MRKLYLSLILCLFISLSAFSQDYVVQLAAFDSKVSMDYFKGLTGITHFEDHNNIHKYYIGGFTTTAEAEAKVDEAKNLGFKAYAMDMDAVRASCALACGSTTPALDPSKIRSIFFDFDKSTLRSESQRQLEMLYSILTQNSEYSVELRAHTDAKGSLKYNESLSMRRAQAAKRYLLAKGISESRIKTSTFGENDPIAKNELSNGSDAPEGRQFNRRVELKIYNPNGTIEPLVEKIDVPDGLRKGK